MHNRFDQLGKHIGAAALAALGSVVTHAEISAETQYADLRFHPNPARGAGRARLGLLSRLVATPCLIELYSQPPDAAQFRACLAKHLAHWQQAARDKRKRTHTRRHTLAPPFLWLITAGTPAALLAELALEPAPGWPTGVYLVGGAVLRAGIIAGNQLPRERSTLLVRLMAAGSLLPNAIAELTALPDSAYEHAVVDSDPATVPDRAPRAAEPDPSREGVPHDHVPNLG